MQGFRRGFNNIYDEIQAAQRNQPHPLVLGDRPEALRESRASLQLHKVVLPKRKCSHIGCLHAGRTGLGNGGSAADAQHFAAEFVIKLARDRAPLPAEPLTVDSSILTAIGNDYGYEHVFARQIAAKMRSEDVFLGITTSGRFPNIIRSLEQSKARFLGAPDSRR